MRFAMFCLLLLLASSGCITERERGNESAENISWNISTNISEETNETWEAQVNETRINETINETAAPPANQTVSETANETANETEAGAVPEGILFGDGKYLLVLEDIVLYGEQGCAAVSFDYANGTTIKRDVLCPSTDYYWTSPEGYRFRIRITETAAGYTGEAWAKVIIYG